MSIDVRCEDGELLADRLSRTHSTLLTKDGPVLPSLSFHDEQHERGDNSDLSKVSTYVNTGSPDGSPPQTPHLLPRVQVDPRLSVSTSVRAWGQLDD